MNRNVLEFARTGLLSAVVTTSVLLPARLLQQRTATPSPLPAQGEPLHVESIGPQELTATMGVGINDKNEVVGTAFGDGEVRAFIVRNRRGELLPLPKGAPYSLATGINEKGEAVGLAGTEESVRGIVWSGKKAGILTSGKRDTVATTISSKSVAAGAAFDNEQRGQFSPRLATTSAEFKSLLPQWTQDNGFSGMLWSKPGEGKAIGEFVPQGGSASGTLVGLTFQKDRFVPAVFKNGKLGALPQVEGFPMAVPMAANDKDLFVGAAVDGERQVKPVGWASGRTVVLPVPGGKQGLALGINSENQVVGVIEAADGEAHAAVWMKGKVIDLNDVIDKTEGWTLVQARGINNKGFVIGTGVKDGNVGAFLVGPIR